VRRCVREIRSLLADRAHSQWRERTRTISLARCMCHPRKSLVEALETSASISGTCMSTCLSLPYLCLLYSAPDGLGLAVASCGNTRGTTIFDDPKPVKKSKEKKEALSLKTTISLGEAADTSLALWAPGSCALQRHCG
jgi:hypothetical protein